jgi:DNA-binding Lrp family transcriptional regulator
MQSSGVIESNIAVLNPAKVGKPITLVVEVEIENEHIDLMDAARESFSKAEEVQQCYYVTGEADFVLIVSVRDMSHYEEFTRRVFFQNHNVKHFKTMVVMDRVKTTLSAVLPA